MTLETMRRSRPLREVATLQILPTLAAHLPEDMLQLEDEQHRST